jgi:hypothetical protein
MNRPATKPKPENTPRRDGCGFVIATSLFTCLFLIINGVALTAVLPLLFAGGNSGSPERTKLLQMLLFIGPVALIFVEWSAIDFLTRRLLRGRGDKR